MAGLDQILVTGANGQVGKAYSQILGNDAVMASREVLDLSQLDSITSVLEEIKPGTLINCAAYTAVDKAEEEESLANIINSQSVAIMAKYCFENNIPFIHYSTDYVFPGDGTEPWKEDDEVGPLSAYGRTKLAGEQEIKKLAETYDSPKYLIFRTSWVYDEAGKNFVNTMISLGKEREVLSIVGDQVGAPTYAGDIAEYSLAAIVKALVMDEFPSGIYHLCGGGETNWHEFAEEIFRQLSGQGEKLEIKEVMSIKTVDYPTPAQRPLNSRMNMDKLKEIFGIEMPNWKDALTRCLDNKSKMEDAA